MYHSFMTSIQQNCIFGGYHFTDVYRQGFPMCLNKLLEMTAVENLKLKGSNLPSQALNVINYSSYPHKHTTLLIFLQVVKKMYPLSLYIFVWKINNVTLLQEKLKICQVHVPTFYFFLPKVHLNMYHVHAHVKTFYFALVFMWNIQSIQW